MDNSIKHFRILSEIVNYLHTNNIGKTKDEENSLWMRVQNINTNEMDYLPILKYSSEGE